MGTLSNNYVFKAMENYPYDLEQTMEALHYALSYDDRNTMALTLMGRVCSEKLFKYEEAKDYFKKVLSINVHAFEAYPYYINVLLWNEDYTEAETFINFALNVKGADKAVLLYKKAILFEQKEEYKTALSCIKQARRYTLNTYFMNALNEVKTRLKDKMPKKKKAKTDKKKSGKKSKKKNT